MIRTTIIPEHKDVHILVPDNYIGKSVEVLMYATDEPQDVRPEKTYTMASLKGLLTENEAEQLQNYVKKSRDEWEENT